MSLKSNILKFQFAIFFQHDVERPDRIFRTLEDDFQVFDTIPVTQPLPEGIVIDDYPVIKFSSSNRVFSCAIAKGRLDFYIEHGHQFGSYSYSSLLNEYYELSSKLISYVINQTPINISRFGFVADYINFSGNPCELIENKMLKNHIDGIAELNVRRNVPKYFEGLFCNDIIAVNSGGIVLNNKPYSGVIIQRDINNRQVPNPSVFTEDNSIKLLSSVIESLSENQMLGVMDI